MIIVSLKDNIEMVKDELNSEEQFFEKAVQTERFLKRYKKPLIGVVTAVVLAVAAGSAYDIFTQSKIDRSNLAFNILMENASDKEAQEELKSLNPKLYDVWSLSQALKVKDENSLKRLQSSKALVVADLAEYELAAMKQDEKALQNYGHKSDALLKDLAMLEAAVLLMESGDKVKAKNKLSMIDINSPVYQLAQSLAHYGVN